LDRSIEAVAATCGLLHDIGSPPFGHAGESAISHWFNFNKAGKEALYTIGGSRQLVQDFRAFEGNAQSLRVVTKLQFLADYTGLNLTFATLSASCKYIATSAEADTGSENHALRKPGYFASEAALIDTIRDKTGTGRARNPITYLVEAADDIVYSVGDIEDGVKKGILSWQDAKHSIFERNDDLKKDIQARMAKILEAGGSELLTFPSGLVSNASVSAFRTAAIGRIVESVLETFKRHYDSIMAGTYKRDLIADCDAASFVAQLKGIGRDQVYSSPQTLKLEIMGRQVIGDLMTIFWEGAQTLPLEGSPGTKDYSGKIGTLISENYRHVFQHFVKENKENADIPEPYHRIQLLTDYVCGMTDFFATRLHAELTDGV
jgi:dGTPase